MTKQLDLIGFEPPSPAARPPSGKPPAAIAATSDASPERKRLNTLFFALFPSPNDADEIRRRASDLQMQHGVRQKLLDTDRFHITLALVGGYSELPRPPQEVIDVATQAAEAVSLPPMLVTLDRLLSFGGRADNRPLVLQAGDGAPAVRALKQQLHWAFGEITGERIKTPDPHMTLSYGKAAIKPCEIAPIRLTFTEFRLIYSHVGLHHHELIGRWPLSNP